MVRLDVLSGKKAGTTWVARRFPVQLGRSARSDFQSEEPGVWEQHAGIVANADEGWVLEAQGEASVSVNGKPARRAVLRNGDAIDLGSLRLRFWLADVRQTGLGFREWLVWTILLTVTAAQVALLFWLRRL